MRELDRVSPLGARGADSVRSTESVEFQYDRYTTWAHMPSSARSASRAFGGGFCEAILCADDPDHRVGFVAGPFGLFAAEFVRGGAEYTQSVLHPSTGQITHRRGALLVSELTDETPQGAVPAEVRAGARANVYLTFLPPVVRDRFVYEAGDPDLFVGNLVQSGIRLVVEPTAPEQELTLLAMTHAQAVVLQARRRGRPGDTAAKLARTGWQIDQWSIPLGPARVIKAHPGRPPFTPQWPAGLPAPPDPADPGPGQVRERRRWRLLGR